MQHSITLYSTTATKLLHFLFGFNKSGTGPFGGSCQIHGSSVIPGNVSDNIPGVRVFNDVSDQTLKPPAFIHAKCPAKIHRSCFCVCFIAEHTKLLENSTKVKEDWKYVAMVLDRLFLWIFTLAVLAGTAGIILQAPTLYDDRIPIIEDKEIDFAGISAGRCRPSY